MRLSTASTKEETLTPEFDDKVGAGWPKRPIGSPSLVDVDTAGHKGPGRWQNLADRHAAAFAAPAGQFATLVGLRRSAQP